MVRKLAFAAVASCVGCAPAVTGEDVAEKSGLAVLGFSAHSSDAVRVSEVATRDEGLREPRDLDFNPEVPGELWIVNRADDSVVTLRDVDDPTSAAKRTDPYAMHFMEEVTSLSFASGMKFGTCGDSRNTYNGQAEPNDFMGPALWSADPTVFAKSNPAAIDEAGFDLGSHLDMMHETPECMGIAWDSANIYYVFEGLTGTLARYDFAADHGPGFDDHTDGLVERFVDVDVARVDGVPSHMVFDHEARLLYVADTGNARIGVLDPDTALALREFQGFETPVQELEGAAWSTLVDADDGELEQPSGIALADGVLYVADNATSRITAFSAETGERIDWLDLDVPAGALMGLRVGKDGDLFVVDNDADRVLRIRPAE